MRTDIDPARAAPLAVGLFGLDCVAARDDAHGHIAATDGETVNAHGLARGSLHRERRAQLANRSLHRGRRIGHGANVGPHRELIRRGRNQRSAFVDAERANAILFARRGEHLIVIDCYGLRAAHDDFRRHAKMACQGFVAHARVEAGASDASNGDDTVLAGNRNVLRMALDAELGTANFDDAVAGANPKALARSARASIR